MTRSLQLVALLNFSTLLTDFMLVKGTLFSWVAFVQTIKKTLEYIFYQLLHEFSNKIELNWSENATQNPQLCPVALYISQKFVHIVGKQVKLL